MASAGKPVRIDPSPTYRFRFTCSGAAAGSEVARSTVIRVTRVLFGRP